jgi:hypothetical protein
MLRELRACIVEGSAAWGTSATTGGERLAFDAWSWLIRHPAAYHLALRLGAAVQSVLPRGKDLLRLIPGPVQGWAFSRDLPRIDNKPFRDRFIDQRK